MVFLQITTKEQSLWITPILTQKRLFVNLASILLLMNEAKLKSCVSLATLDAKFSDVFKTITSDNGPEFATLSKYEDTHHTKIYFAHPYCSCERPQNERYNGFIREYIPKGISMETYNDEDIFYIADKINARPRKRLNYYSPEELFEAELDTIYAM